MPSLRRVVAVLLPVLVAACEFRPFEIDSSRRASRSAAALQVSTEPLGPFGHNPNPRPIAVCYSSQFNTREEVVQRARELCPNEGAIGFFEEDAFFNGCSLFQPFRVTFICTPGPAPASPYN